MQQVEARAYGPESTHDEVAAIQANIYMLRPGLVMYREVPVPSPFQIGLFSQKLVELTAGLPSFDLVMDLSRAKPPGKACREALRELFARQQHLRHVAVFTGGNFLINSVAKLLLKNSGVRNMTMCKDEAAAIAAATQA